jgi:hypothetical protein
MKKELIEEINETVYQENIDELENIFEKGLASDGGEYWITGNIIIESLSKAGYTLTKNILTD